MRVGRTPDGRAICELPQLPLRSPEELDGAVAPGWFYDDFTGVSLVSCAVGEEQTIRLTSAALPIPHQAVVTMECLSLDRCEGPT